MLASKLKSRPTATILAVNIAIPNLLNYILSEIVVGIVYNLSSNDSVRRVPSLVALIIAFIVVYPHVKAELAYKEQEESHSFISGSNLSTSFVTQNYPTFLSVLEESERQTVTRQSAVIA